MQITSRTNFITISNLLTKNQKLSVVNLLLLISRIDRSSEHNVTENEEAYIGALLLNFEVRLWDIKLGDGPIVYNGCEEYLSKYGVEKMIDDLKSLKAEHKELLFRLVNEFSSCDSIPSETKLRFMANIYQSIGIQINKTQQTNNRETDEFILVLNQAGLGNADAQYILGTWYLEGQEISHDIEKAIEWLQKASEQGHSQAQFNLGTIFHDVEGDYFNTELAFKWFLNSATQGFSDAQVSLGSIYFEGDGVSQNIQEAVNWFQKAAEQGDTTAQYLLGKIHFYGHGVPQSYPIAAKWFQQAADLGDEEAAADLELLKPLL
jgi:hypothetical protein